MIPTAFGLGVMAAARVQAAGSAAALLLHFDGTNGSTTITDSSAYARTVTVAGNAQITTSNVKFGTGSLLLDGSGDYLTIPYAPELHCETGDCTVDCWYRTTDFNKTVLAFGAPGGTTAWEIKHAGGGGQITFVAYHADGSTTTIQSSGSSADNGWRHVAWTRSGNDYRFYSGGNLAGVGVVTNASPLKPNTNSDFRLVVGASAALSSTWTGRLDEVRIVAGSAEWTTSSFTPPAAPYEG